MAFSCSPTTTTATTNLFFLSHHQIKPNTTTTTHRTVSGSPACVVNFPSSVVRNNNLKTGGGFNGNRVPIVRAVVDPKISNKEDGDDDKSNKSAATGDEIRVATTEAKSSFLDQNHLVDDHPSRSLLLVTIYVPLFLSLHLPLSLSLSHIYLRVGTGPGVI